MEQHWRTLPMAVGCLLIVFSIMCQAQDQTAKWEPLVQSVQDVLAGRSIENKNIIISPSAWLAFGNRYEPLRPVVAGDSKTSSLKEEPARTAASLNLKINDAEDAAFLTLMTQAHDKTAIRFHTVVFMKDSTARWIIQAWHTSE